MADPFVPSDPQQPLTSDVCVIGAGVAGSSLAFALARTGVHVVLIDARGRYPSCFKAEKIEPDQAAMLRELDLYPVLASIAAPIGGVHVARNGVCVDYTAIAQLGAPYHEMANAIRATLPPDVRCVLGRVVTAARSTDAQVVTLTDGSTIETRLIALATGAQRRLGDALGVARRVIDAEHSTAFGFSIAPARGGTFHFDALTYLPPDTRDAIDYLTLFACPDGMRANLFTYWTARDPRISAMVRHPRHGIDRSLPRLDELIGQWRVTSRVDACPIPLWAHEPIAGDGFVLVGDACQNACPATGSGLSKVLTDVVVLRDLVPQWLRTPGMSASKTREYAIDARKTACDAASLAAARYRKRLGTDRGIRMCLHRAKARATMAWLGRLRARIVTDRDDEWWMRD